MVDEMMTRRVLFYYSYKEAPVAVGLSSAFVLPASQSQERLRWTDIWYHVSQVFCHDISCLSPRIGKFPATKVSKASKAFEKNLNTLQQLLYSNGNELFLTSPAARRNCCLNMKQR